MKSLLKCDNRPLLIFVSGPVGVGKTTFSRNLLRFLSSKEGGVCYDLFVSFPLFSYLFFKFTTTLFYGLKPVMLYEKIRVHPSTLFMLRIRGMPWFIRFLLEFLEFMSVVLHFSLRLFLKCFGRKIIIFEEGLINVIAGYIEIFGRHSLIIPMTMAFLRFMQHLFNLKIVYLDVEDAKILVNRWISRGYPKATSLVGIDHHLKYVLFIRYSKELVKKVFTVIEVDNTNKSPQDTVIEFVLKIFDDFRKYCSSC